MANVANVVTVAGPDYSAWHYAPDAPVRLTRGSDGRVDLHILVGAWSAAPTAETVTVRWQVTDGPGAGAESVVPTADVTPVDAEFAERLRAVDDAPVTGPRPLAVAPYRLALARRGNRYAEAVVRGVAEGATVRYTVDVRPTSGAPITLGPYSVVAAVPEFAAADMVGGRFGDLVDAGPAGSGMSGATTASPTCGSTSTTSRPTGRSGPGRIGGPGSRPTTSPRRPTPALGCHCSTGPPTP